MDKNFRLFGKISIIDICAVVALICAVWFVTTATTTVSAVSEGAVSSRYTVQVLQKKPDFFTHVKTGEKVRDILKDYEIGVLVDCYTETYTEQSPDIEANVIRQAAVDGYQNFYLVIEAPMQVSASATSVGLYDVMVGKEVFVKTKDFAVQGIITKLERGGENAN